MFIIADHREKPSGIPGMLEKSALRLSIETLPAGDYQINGQLLAERKTAEDFVQSLIHNRLFERCLKLRHSRYNLLIIIEGNPFRTGHHISRAAVQGALVSIATSWQIPILFTRNPEETADLLISAAGQRVSCDKQPRRGGHKPKRLSGNKLYFLQGLPSVGPELAIRLLRHFGSVMHILNAPFEELCRIRGIGKKKAENIRRFLDSDQSMKFPRHGSG